VTSPARILIVDQDATTQRSVAVLLASRGFDVEVADSGAVALKAAIRRPDLILLDLELPDMDGLDICRQLIERSSAPIIIVSARSAEPDKVRALDVGAEDYVTKPFGCEELLARIRVALRRVMNVAEPAGRIDHAGLTIDHDRHRVIRNGQPIRLTPKEYDLLALLARNQGRVLRHRAILRALWGPHAIDQTEHLWTLVRTLRQKLEPDPASPVYLVSEYGIGYRLGHPDSPVDQETAES
jgi:two-component system KDP operon response regulator KdpE